MIFTHLSETLAKMKLEPREPVQLDLIEYIDRLPKPVPPDPVLPDGRVYYIGYLGGRCPNGSEGSAGTLNHVVLVVPGQILPREARISLQRFRARSAWSRSDVPALREEAFAHATDWTHVFKK